MREASDVFIRELADRYRLQQGIGEGGMAIIYLAHDERHDRPVVVKAMRRELLSADSALRFVREVQVTAKLHHPNILPLIDSGTADDTPYYVVPLVSGGSLRDRLDREGPLPVDTVLRIAYDVASALDHAHAHGVVHRDIKPENILLEGDRAIVADFGIAHAVSEASGERLTATGIAIGTPAYMSPEQTDPSRVDGRSDLYSLGCVIYEMLTGHSPFGGATPQEIFARHAVDPVPSVRAARPGLPAGLEDVVATALAKAPADRYQSGLALVQALDSAVHGRRGAARHSRRGTWVAALTVAALTAASILVWRATGHATFGKRDWIVVADLAGDAADSSLHHALRDALVLTLQQSRYVNVEPSSAITQAMRMMQRPDTTSLTEPVSREVALRIGARAVLVSRVTRLDSTYSFTARVIAPESGADIITVQERAAGRGHVLETLDRLAVDIRKRLGEQLSATEPVMSLGRATTQSLDALRAWTRGNQLISNGEVSSALEQYERAVALDSNFAMAHSALGGTLYRINDRDRGDKHFARALALVDRLTDRERLVIRATVAKWRDQTDDAVKLYRQVLLQYPDELRARFDLGYVLLFGRRYNEAIEQFDWLRLHDPKDAGVRINLATSYKGLHQYEKALVEYRAAFALHPAWSRSSSNIVGEFGGTLILAGHSASAESLFHVQLDGGAEAHARAHRSLALLAVYRGQSAAARDLLRQALAEDVGSSSATSLLRDRMYLMRTLIDVGKLDSARLLLRTALEFSRKQSLDPYWLGVLGQLAVQLGDRGAAKELEARVRGGAQAGNVIDAATLHCLLGEIALAEGKGALAREEFDAAVAAYRRPQSFEGAARAALAQGRRKDAEALFADVVAEDAVMNEELQAFFTAHLELGRLAAARGDTAAARRHLRWIATQWAGGDSDLTVRRAAMTALASLDGRGEAKAR